MVPGRKMATLHRSMRTALLQRLLHGLALMGALLVLSLAHHALAQEKKTLVILEVQGGNKQLQQAMTNALRDKYTLITPAQWAAAAKKLKVTGQATEDVALVASELKVDAVITGKVKQDKDGGGWKLNIAARQGTTGKPVGKIIIDLKSQKIEPANITQVEQEIPDAVAKAIAGEEPPPVAPAVAETKTPSQLGVEEDPIAKMEKDRKKLEEEKQVKRPVFYPFIDVGAGLIINGRNFTFEEDSATNKGCYDFSQPLYEASGTKYQYGSKLTRCPRYDTSVAAGVHVDLTAYPLAFLNINPVRGLGLGGSFDYMFWPPSRTGSGAAAVDLETREFRFEFGLRYHWNILNKRSRPSILANVQYGGHYFAIAKQEKTYPMTFNENGNAVTPKGIDDHGLPDIFYQYVTIGLGGRVPYFANDKMYFGLLVNVNVHVLLGAGEIATRFEAESPVDKLYGNGGYGPLSGGFGLRATFSPVEAMLWKGLTIRLQGFFETFRYGFALGADLETKGAGQLPPAQGARHLAPGAVDTFFGGIVQVGYQY